MRFAGFVILTILMLTGLLSGIDINLNDNQVISIKDIVVMIDNLRSYTIDTTKALEMEIKSFVEKKGYFDANLNVNKSDSTIIVGINSGLLFHLHNINYSYQGDSLDELRVELDGKFSKQNASETNILACLEEAIEIYTANGYPFAQSKLLSLEKIVPDIINLNLEITSGPIVTIDSLQFNSDKNIDTKFLQRKAGLMPGELFSQERIERSLQNINSLGYLFVENVPTESYSNNYTSCSLIYNIRHRGSNRIEGALGYNPQNDKNDGFLYGFINLALYNPIGDGKSFFLKWNKPNVSNSHLNFRYENPYLFGTSWDAALDVSQERFSDFYLSLGGGVTLSYNISSQYNFNFGLRWSRIDAQGEIFRSVFSSRIYEAGIGLTLSNFSNSELEIFGKSFSAQITYLHKRLYPTLSISPEKPSFNPFKAEIGLHLGLKLSEALFSDLKARFEGFSEDETLISPAEMVKLGGRHSIRGYSEEQFITPRALWTNLELGFYQESSLKSYLFADIGYARLADIYTESQMPGFENQFLFGAGLGFKLFSGQTGLDLNVGWSKDDNLGEGKLYLIVENRF
jgi:outer membrane protein insertion porin family